MPDGPSPSPRMTVRRSFRRWLIAAAILGGVAAALVVWRPWGFTPTPTGESVAPASAGDFLGTCGAEYRLEVRTTPRPLRIHHVRIDLGRARMDLVAAVAEDPDDEGPANAALTRPMTLATRAQAVVLVNANPWRSLPDVEGKRHTNWSEGLPVEALGLAASSGTLRSPPVEQHCAFWVDRGSRPHVGNPARDDDVREGVAGFLRLLEAGRNLHEPGDKIHPRTAVGLDSVGRFLHLVVVDGRQPGYSEGMDYFELAELMKDLGCSDAVNLDGGGSSIMILADGEGALRVVNDPSTKENGVSVARPIPVALVARLKK